MDITVTPDAAIGNIQAKYVSISNGGANAVCIRGLALTFPSGSKAGFSTNVAAFCGAIRSISHTPVLDQQASGEVENPKCIWIDRDGSNGIPHQGMGVHLPSFSDSNANLGASYTGEEDLMCISGPRFRMYPHLKTEGSILVFPYPPEFVTEWDPNLFTRRPVLSLLWFLDGRCALCPGRLFKARASTDPPRYTLFVAIHSYTECSRHIWNNIWCLTSLHTSTSVRKMQIWKQEYTTL